MEKKPGKAQKSRKTNGSKFLDGDGRSAGVRRQKDLFEQYIASITGVVVLSPHIFAIARRAAALTAWCEMEESRLAESGGENFDSDAYFRGAGLLRRLLGDLGLDLNRSDPDDDEPNDLDAFLLMAELEQNQGRSGKKEGK